MSMVGPGKPPPHAIDVVGGVIVDGAGRVPARSDGSGARRLPKNS